jgi:ATPase subunit of ABC transporter with duplicated ATPase domains
MVRSCLIPFKKSYSVVASNSHKSLFVSFHFCYRSVEALSESLSEWGEEEGAIVVISHDKSFCDKVGFTHVATVKDGSLVLEQRNSTDADWDDADWDSSDRTLQRSSEDEELPQETKESKEIDSKLRKKANKAPKRESKIEALEIETKLDEDETALENEVVELADLINEQGKIDQQFSELVKEWEQLQEELPPEEIATWNAKWINEQEKIDQQFDEVVEESEQLQEELPPEKIATWNAKWLAWKKDREKLVQRMEERKKHKERSIIEK